MSEIEVAEPVMPIPLQYNKQETNRSAYEERIQSYLYPSSQGIINGSSANRTLKWLVGSQSFLDGKSSYLALDARVINATIGGNNFVYFTPYTECWIKSLTIYTNNGVLIEQIRDYNVLGAILKRSMEPSYSNSVGLECLNMTDNPAYAGGLNINSLASGNEIGLSAAQKQVLALQKKRYVIELLGSGFLNSHVYLPLKAMAQQNSNAFSFEIEFGATADVLVAYNAAQGTAYTNTNGVDYEFSNIVYSQSLVKDDVLETSIMETIKTTPIMLHYDIFRHYQNTILTNSSGETISISEFQENVRSIINVFRRSEYLGNLSYDQTRFMNPKLLQYQLQIGQKYINAQPIKTGISASATDTGPQIAEEYYEYTKTYDKNKKWFMGFQQSTYGTNTSPDGTDLTTAMISNKQNGDFVLTTDMEIYPVDAHGDPLYNDYFSGLNTKQNPQPLQLILVHGQNAFAVSMDSFTHYDSHCVVQQGEVYILS